MKHIRNAVNVAAILLLTLSLTSCGGKEKQEKADNKFGKMEVVIPDELKDNPEIVAYIEGMSEVVDEYAILMDEMIDELDDFEGKEWEDLKLGEQLKLAKSAAKFAVKAAPITAKWGEFEIQREMESEELTEEQIMALETVMERFEKRMEQIEEKNQDFFGGVDG